MPRGREALTTLESKAVRGMEGTEVFQGPYRTKNFYTVRGKNRAFYSFLTIHPSIRNIPATIKRKGVARGMPPEVLGVAVWE